MDSTERDLWLATFASSFAMHGHAGKAAEQAEESLRLFRTAFPQCGGHVGGDMPADTEGTPDRGPVAAPEAREWAERGGPRITAFDGLIDEAVNRLAKIIAKRAGM